MRKAEYVTDQEILSVCSLCPNHCQISDGKRGKCLGRGRENGRTALFNYGMVTSIHLDPIEKKPLYHFFPGKGILSVGTFGCNLSCRFCQNAEISQQEVPAQFLTPEQLLEQAASIDENVGVAFTYNEPGIWYEFVMDCAPLLRNRGLKVVLVTNGYLESEPWKDLCEVTDAMNIDLKGFSEDFYRKVTGGSLDPVLNNIAFAVRHGVHVELTNLVVTGLNTNPDDFDKLVDFTAGVSKTIPLHISRYFPRYRETEPPTDPDILRDFYTRAAKKLSFVYVGNVPLEAGNHTRCPSCGEIWIKRRGYMISIQRAETHCACGKPIYIPGLVAAK